MKYILILFTFLGFTTFGLAQSKTAHINYSQLVLLMPETKAAGEALEAFTQNYKTELAKLEGQYKTKVDALKKEEQTLLPTIIELRQKEIKDLEASYAKLNEAAKKEINDKDNALFVPIFEKAKTAVTAIAKEKGYDYVIDSSKGQYVYMNPKDNILELAKKKLGL
ncbi:MAG: hypothetical protein RL060_857 [Bacteroidota bacterium]|jgi:outer membrane protein